MSANEEIEDLESQLALAKLKARYEGKLSMFGKDDSPDFLKQYKQARDEFAAARTEYRRAKEQGREPVVAVLEEEPEREQPSPGFFKRHLGGK